MTHYVIFSKNEDTIPELYGPFSSSTAAHDYGFDYALRIGGDESTWLAFDGKKPGDYLTLHRQDPRDFDAEARRWVEACRAEAAYASPDTPTWNLKQTLIGAGLTLVALWAIVLATMSH